MQRGLSKPGISGGGNTTQVINRGPDIRILSNTWGVAVGCGALGAGKRQASSNRRMKCAGEARGPLQLREGGPSSRCELGEEGVWKTGSKGRALFVPSAKNKGWCTGFAELMCKITCFSDF